MVLEVRGQEYVRLAWQLHMHTIRSHWQAYMPSRRALLLQDLNFSLHKTQWAGHHRHVQRSVPGTLQDDGEVCVLLPILKWYKSVHFCSQACGS